MYIDKLYTQPTDYALPNGGVNFAKSLICLYAGPMLTYLSSGERNYFDRPIHLHSRGVWEIQAVIRGSIAPTFANGERGVWARRTLFIFPPESIHGWTGQAEEHADIVVFHFSTMPREMQRLCSGNNNLRLVLDDDEARLIEQMFRQLAGDYPGPSAVATLRSRIVSDQITLLSVLHVGANGNVTREGEQLLVSRAISLFSEEMQWGIRSNEIAQKLDMNPSHLRRLFHRVAGRSPREVFEEMRMKRARELCINSSYALGFIAGVCGYAEQSSFSKAVWRYWGRSPSNLRRNAS